MTYELLRIAHVSSAICHTALISNGFDLNLTSATSLPVCKTLLYLIQTHRITIIVIPGSYYTQYRRNVSYDCTTTSKSAYKWIRC